MGLRQFFETDEDFELYLKTEEEAIDSWKGKCKDGLVEMKWPCCECGADVDIKKPVNAVFVTATCDECKKKYEDQEGN